MGSSESKNLEEEIQWKDPISVLVVGAGMRGQVYATYAKDFPTRMKVVGVAEPKRYRREMMRNLYKVEEKFVFEDWQPAAEREKFADAVVIATMDCLHKDPCIAFAKKGYHILLEKPMAPNLSDCEQIVKVCKEQGIILAVGHVLRYRPHYLKVNDILESGKIGDIVSIQHMEPVGWYHFAHSYVRGNWRRQEDSGFSLLAKCCHDIDLINSFMKNARCVAVSSFGALSHFTKSQKPNGAGERCLDCAVETNCPYSAVKIYLEPTKRGVPNGFCFSVADKPTPETIEENLRKGPYGRCVYECDNDVISNQVVNMMFEGGKTVSMSMVAFTKKLCVRQTKIFGTKGELVCDEDSPITVYNFTTRKEETFECDLIPSETTTMSGHGFADYHLMHAFVKSVTFNDPNFILSSPDECLQSHRLVFLSEQSRVENRVINIQESF